MPQTFTVYQTLAISLLAMLFGEFLSFFGHNSTFARWGTVSYNPGQFQIGSPVRISLGQIYIGICLPGNNESTLALKPMDRVIESLKHTIPVLPQNGPWFFLNPFCSGLSKNNESSATPPLKSVCITISNIRGR